MLYRVVVVVVAAERDADALPKTQPTHGNAMVTVGEHEVTTEPGAKEASETAGEDRDGGAIGTSPRKQTCHDGGAVAAAVAAGAESARWSTRERIGMWGARKMVFLGGGIPL